MAGLGEYGDEGFSEYHAKKNPFLVTQSLSANTVNPAITPLKDFGIISGPIAAAIAAAAKAAAATKVGAAVVGAAKAVGAKLAATKVGSAVVKGVQAVSKGVKALKATKVGKFFSKTLKKPKVGNVAKEGATEGTKSFASKAMESFKKGEMRSGVENIKSTKSYNVASNVKGELDKADAEGDVHASGMRDRASRYISNMPTVGDSSESPKEDLSSVLTYRVAPFKMKSPFKNKGATIRDTIKNMKFGEPLKF
jgi:hypothetical protein